jgi:hypothetical protein
VFRLHSSRRMKPTSSGRGVSIPSRECRAEVYTHMQNVGGVAMYIFYSPTKRLPPTSTQALHASWSNLSLFFSTPPPVGKSLLHRFSLDQVGPVSAKRGHRSLGMTIITYKNSGIEVVLAEGSSPR